MCKEYRVEFLHITNRGYIFLESCVELTFMTSLTGIHV